MIAKYIQELLENNNRVIIPDFGAFLVRATSKNKDKKDLALKLEDIYFSPFLKFNDELLSKYIIEKENISKEEANSKISEFIKLVKTELDNEKPFIIENFGKFIIDKQGKVQFITVAKEGLKEKKEVPKTTKGATKVSKEPKAKIKSETLTTKPAKTINEKKQAEIKSDKKEPEKAEAIKQIPTVKSEPSQKITRHTKAKTVSQPKKSINKGLVWSVAIGVPVAVIFIWAMLNLDTVNDFIKKEKKPEEIKIEKLKAKVSKIEVKKKEAVKEVSETDVKKTEKKLDDTASKTELKGTAIQRGKYYIVAGSFRNENFAENFAEKLKKQGYKAEKLTRPNGMFAVSYASYKDKQKALAEINYLTKEKNLKAWLLYY